jgi:hypothetical protein
MLNWTEAEKYPERGTGAVAEAAIKRLAIERADLRGDAEPLKGEWSAPMSKTEMARRITGKKKARPRDVATLLEKHGVSHVSGHKWLIRLDTLDSHTRKKLEQPLK